MAIIIEHNFSKRAGKAGRDLLTGSFSCFMQELEDKKALLGEMVMQARLFLEQEGMDPGAFVLSESYLREFLFTRLDDQENEQNRYAEIVYLSRQDDRIIALCQFAVPKEGEIMISYQIYSMDLTADGDSCWKLYNFQSGSWLEDEEDCFDVKQVLEEISHFAADGPQIKD